MSFQEALNRQKQWRPLTKLKTAEAIVHGLPRTSNKVQINTIFPPKSAHFPYNFHCSDADKFHRRVLNQNSLLYARGCVIICNDTPLGHVKLKGERTFLAWQTVQNKNSFPLVFGGIYSLEESLIRDIDCTRVPYRTWGAYTVDSFEARPLRLIRDSYLCTIWNNKSVSQLIDAELQRWTK